MENKQVAFLNYAKSKGMDASLCVYDGKFLAIINPVDDKGIFQGESEVSIGEAMQECKERLINKNKK